MVARFLTELQPSISPARLQRYQSLTGDPFESAVNYLWNMALAEALFDDQFLRRRHGDVKRGLHWLNPRMVDCIEWYDRFPDVYHHGRMQIAAKLRMELGIP